MGRERLTRERILRATLRVVDEDGMGALSIRRLAAELGVDPMVIYHHLPGKEAGLSGIVEMVYGEMHASANSGAAWQDLVRENAHPAKTHAGAFDPRLVPRLEPASRGSGGPGG